MFTTLAALPRSDAAEPSADASASDAPWPARTALALLPVVAIVAVKIAVNMAVASRYGWHRDELYYADTGRHLSIGYVDFPPVTPWLARLGLALFGPSLAGLRFLAVLAGCGVVIITALITRDLGGGRRAQVLAAVAITPLTLGANAMFQTVSFDQLSWAFVLWATVWVLRTGGARSWLLLGLAVGMAWMTKFTVGFLIAGLVAGFVCTSSGRRRLRGPGPWLATLAAWAIAAPNMWWQARHGWPSVEFFTSRSGDTRADNPPLAFVLEFFFIAGPVAVVVWLTGMRRLVAYRRLRAIGIAVAIVMGGWLGAGGKAYYAAPVLIAAFAAGAVHLESRAATGATTSPHRRMRSLRSLRSLTLVIVVTSAIASPVILPVLPTEQMVDLGLWHARDDYAEELGWSELVHTVSDAWHGVPAAERSNTAIVASNYGEAGALDRWGPALGLPRTVSGHLSHRYWTPSPRTMANTQAIVIGFDAQDARHLCRSSDIVARIENRAGVDNEEAGVPVRRCTVRGSIRDRWPWLAER